MEFHARTASGQEVRFAGHERGYTKFLETGRWKISMSALASYLSGQLAETSFGTSVERFVFCFEIADFELWGKWFGATSGYASYRPKVKEYWSVGQLRWSDVKHLDPIGQIQALRGAIQVAILRVGEKPRKPKDFDYIAFAASVDALIAGAPEDALVARPAA
ncbi:MAG: hypothetical protein ACLPX9_10665 [Rhodomicrobium sp.]